MSVSRGSIWYFQTQVTSRLLLWGAFSVAIGLSMFLVEDPFWTGFASQAVVWGGIDALLAIFGERSSRKKQAVLLPTTIEQVEASEARKLRLILLVNTLLNVLYITGGAWLAFSQPEPLLQGIGWGVIVQGGFLFIFDLIHTLLCPKP